MRTEKQKKAANRNIALANLSRMENILKKMSTKANDCIIDVKIEAIILRIDSLKTLIKDLDIESWKA